MKKHGLLLFSAALLLAGMITFPAISSAQEAVAEKTGLPERIIRPMQAVDPVTLRTEGVTIRLWGIKPAQTTETPLALKALDLMDKLTNGQIVNCKIVGGTIPDLVGQCKNQSNEDIALSLLENGFVVVDRRQTYNTVLATGYAKAQEAARNRARGVWQFVKDEDQAVSSVPPWLRPYYETLLPFALLFGPFAGLAVMALVMHFGLRRLGARQDSEIEAAGRKEAALALRERQILVSTLEGELGDNKNKIDAFLAIYGDMLETLRDTEASPKYQQTGDIIQKHPAFSRTVFEASMAKLPLLDVKTAGVISKVYSSLPKDPEYINLDPDVPLETACKLVEKTVGEAKALIPVIDSAMMALRTAGQGE